MTGELILEKARETMKLLYSQPESEHHLSLGWLENFKLRHGIKSFRRFGESGSVNIEDMEKNLETIRKKIDKFSKRDVFNMDETGLFTCYNMNCHYRGNKRAWMTSVIFEEYIRWFDKKMHGRRVLFVVDNCPAHPKIIEGLQNVELFFLPPNMTSKVQPCDVEIIRAFKTHYRRRLYREIVEGYELGQSDPAKINVLDAINFSVAAWTVNVHQETIVNCFRHCKIRSEDGISTILEEDSTSESNIHELEIVINNLGYHYKMDVNSLLDYLSENDTCLEVQSLEKIVANVLNVDDEPEYDAAILLEPVTRKEVIAASKTLHNFWMQFEKTTPGVLDAIRKIRDELQKDFNLKKKQTTIDSYFSRLS